MQNLVTILILNDSFLLLGLSILFRSLGRRRRNLFVILHVFWFRLHFYILLCWRLFVLMNVLRIILLLKNLWVTAWLFPFICALCTIIPNLLLWRGSLSSLLNFFFLCYIPISLIGITLSSGMICMFKIGWWFLSYWRTIFTLRMLLDISWILGNYILLPLNFNIFLLLHL